MRLEFMTYCARTLPMINAVENAQLGDISTQSQCVKSCTDHWVPNDSNGSTLYANKWVKADTGVHQPKDMNSTPYEAEPGLYIEPISVLA